MKRRCNLPAAIALALLLASFAACRADSEGDSSAVHPADGVIDAEWDTAVGDDADYVFDSSVIRTYELMIDEADWQWLNDNERLERYVPATLFFEGEEYQEVAVRYKGFFGALGICFDPQGNRTCKKLSIKLKFSEYDENRRFYGLKRLNFNSMEFDPTKMHEVLAYGLFREAGVIAPRATYAKLVVNGERLGLFALVEQVDGMFTRSRFPDGGRGNLYKEVWPVQSDPGPYLQALRTNREEEPSVEKMMRFSQALDEASDETFRSVLESWTDIDMLVSYLAVDRLIDNWDGFIAWYCITSDCFNHNYFWYEDTVRDRVWLIPWDLDHTFEVPSPIRTFFSMPDWDVAPDGCAPIPVFFGIRGRPPMCDDLIRRLSTLTWDPYVERTRELLDGPFRANVLQARIDALAERIAGAVAEDPNGPTVAQWQSAVSRLKDGVATMRSYIEAKVGSE